MNSVVFSRFATATKAMPAMRLVDGIVGRRGFAASSKGTVHPGYQKIKKTYAKFQVDDGVPIHLKAGVRDYILYKGTLFLIAIGLYQTFEYYYTAGFPKKAC